MSIDRRMLIRGAVACACCLKAGVTMASDKPSPDGATQPHWSYEGDGRPEKWGELRSDFRTCQLGLEQTPIDLGNGIKGDVGSVDYDYKPSPLRIVHNGCPGGDWVTTVGGLGLPVHVQQHPADIGIAHPRR